MGRTKRLMKEAARAQKCVTPACDVQIDGSGAPGYDDYQVEGSNALILPQKRKKKKELQETPKKEKPVKRLSKKRVKELQKVLERRKNRGTHNELLEELSKYQAKPSELAMMISTSAMQTGGLRTLGQVGETAMKIPDRPNTLKGVAKILRKEEKKSKVAEILGFLSDESSESEDSAETPDYEPLSPLPKPPKSEPEMPVKPEPVKPSTETKQVIKVPAVPASFVLVKRTKAIQEQRESLPIFTEEQPIMEAINSNATVIICGETGSGKTTQVPQFLYEAAYCADNRMIGITEPRRVAASSMARRVAYEMQLSEDIVSYQVRFEGNVTDQTKIMFMTDGVLLKEVQADFLLTRFSVIIIDEAHERSSYSDILIGLLSRIVLLRQKRGNPLKLIIMSATLRAEDFTTNTHLFKVPPPVIHVAARQFPVTVHFNRTTPPNYVKEAFKKVCKIHRRLPSGSILVFLTSQREIHTLCRMLRKKFPPPQQTAEQPVVQKKRVPPKRKRKRGAVKPEPPPAKKINLEPEKPKDFNLDKFSVVPLDDEQAETVVATTQEDDEKEEEDLWSSSEEEASEDEEPLPASDAVEPLWVLPLYSLLDVNKQAHVFKEPPNGYRSCIVATNVAETSLTIPRVKYVVDSGKVKRRVYDRVTGVSAFIVDWTSKASADQRMGRAGRVSPGHCYRLYSAAVFNDNFKQFAEPDICLKPVEDLVLQMKAMNIDKVVNFPFPTPPSIEAIKAAEKKLILMGALKEPPRPSFTKDLKDWEWSAQITDLGRAMSCFPVGVRYAKLLAIGHQHGLLPYIITIVAGLTVQEVFMPTAGDVIKGNEWRDIREVWAGEDNSFALGDIMVLLKAICAAEYDGCTPSFCEKHGLRYKAIIEIRKLRHQLSNELNLLIPGLNLAVDRELQPPTDEQALFLRQLMLICFCDHVAKRMEANESTTDDKIEKNSYQSIEVQAPVYIHPSSVLFKKLPPYIVYQEIFETSKMYMRMVCQVEPQWLPQFAPHLCTMSLPLKEPEPYYNAEKDRIECEMSSTFGPHAWAISPVALEHPPTVEKIQYFARYLLNGLVIEGLAPFTLSYLMPPDVLTKSWAKLQTRTRHITSALMRAGIDTKKGLIEAWKEEPRFLLREFLEWLPESSHVEARDWWPPVPELRKPRE